MFDRIFVVGASAGGMQALTQLASKLGSDFPAPVLVAFHIGPHASQLPACLNAKGGLHSEFAVDGARLQSGRLVLAPADRHLMVERDRVRVTRGARENYSRPAIDPLFRSAGYVYRHRVVGVLLTGQLGDGSVGLQAIKAYGGTTIVQDPADAAYPEMPATALAIAHPDYVVALKDLPQLMHDLVATPAAPVQPSTAAETFSMEHQMATDQLGTIETLNSIGEPAGLSCPECGGAIWRIGEEPAERYRCHTGHAFSTINLALGQEHAVEEALWNAVRAFEEKRSLFQRRADSARRAGDERAAEESELVVNTTAEQQAIVRRLVLAGAGDRGQLAAVETRTREVQPTAAEGAA
jgi:two-component system, chemotaxis family, protein-glutamate methylesterase/glutaminase